MKAAVVTAIAELRQWPHWVVWRQETRDGKSTKVPCVATSPRKHASSTDPDTWATYEAAAQTVQRGGAAGVGYVFTPHDEYTGVDLDKCVTDGQVVPEAMSIVQRLDSYTELSPTGTGLHIFVRGRINGDRNRTGKTPWGGEFESYDQGRYFTVTEQHLQGTPTTIEARQDELDAIRGELFPAPERKTFNGTIDGTGIDDDVELLERARNARNGRDFDALYGGDLGHHGDDESAGDLALCNHLAFWAGPHPERIDSLFRRSGLMREKWDSPRGQSTYGRITVDKALEGRTEFFTPKRTPTFEGRVEADADARKRAADLLGLDDRRVVGGRAWGEDLDARIEVDISDGSMLRFKSLNSYTSPAKINSEISFQIGASPTLTQATIYELFRHLRLICDFQEAVTLDHKAMDCGITFLQEAQTWPADMVDNQAERWQAFQKLAEIDPIALSKASGKAIAAECTVIDSNGIRYVRTSWYAAHARQFASPSVADQIVARMVGLGWEQAGNEGRVKATQPNTRRTLQWAFFTVSMGWEQQ